MIAKVLVDVPVKAVDRLFDYEIPSDFESVLEIGSRVIVPFGNRDLMGFCLDITTQKDTLNPLKPIRSVLDIEPYVTNELIELAKTVSMDTTTVLIRVLETMIPSALKAVYKPKLKVIDSSRLSNDLRLLFRSGDLIDLNEEVAPFLREIKKAMHDKQIEQYYDIVSKSKPKFQRMVRLIDPNYLPKTQKHSDYLNYLAQQPNKEALLSESLSDTNLSQSIVQTLEKKNVVSTFDREIYREIETIEPPKDKVVVLTDEQRNAFERMRQSLNKRESFLLHGVTGSGKTELYLAMIEDVLKSGKEVIFLVPEIALTPMMVQRFKGRFTNQVAILHSGLSMGEKYDEWRKIIRKEVKIVIGARSACFAPFTNLGLIIIDECHESTYKQDDMPKYYAIDICQHRADYYQIPMILGSATPNVETYARYKRGYYTLIELPNRAQNVTMPTVKLIDMKEEFKSGNLSLLSKPLQTAIADRLEKHEQTMLLINRRGYASFVICRHCGYVPMCPNCDISLTYHEVEHAIKCHYCGYKEPLPKVCPKCGSSDLQLMGSGTQKIESEIQALFPQATLIRMDNDTTRTKNAHEKLLNSFETQGNILIGTQMIAKGLDYPKVTLVGIIQADSNLYQSDFRAPEKTFQLIVQVSGRAGRHELKGDVLVQVFNTDHYAIKYAVNQDYQGFYDYEMRIRKLARYIPFYFLVQIECMGENIRDLFLRGKEIVNRLKSSLSSEAIVLGPALPPVARIKNKYRCQLLIKYRNEPNLDDALFQIVDDFQTNEFYLSIDKSPM